MKACMLCGRTDGTLIKDRICADTKECFRRYAIAEGTSEQDATQTAEAAEAAGVFEDWAKVEEALLDVVDRVKKL